MYPNPNFTVKDENFIKKFIELFPLATLICSHQGKINTTYIPLIWKNQRLLGHIDINNPMAQLLNNEQEVKLIFNGPENYISPGHFTTEEFPTYNYMKVEVNAKASALNTTELRNSIKDMTHQLDKNFPNNLKGKEERMEKILNYIYGFKLDVCNYIGRFKMSQDKSETHFLKAAEILKKEESERQLKILDYFIKFEKQKNH